jgi:two-component system cell cycle sensor histidine kinase/response regulator CckA
MAWVKSETSGKQGIAGALGGLLWPQRAAPPAAEPAAPSREAALELAFGAAPFGVYVADGDGVVRWANPALGALVGLPREQLAGTPVGRLLAAPPEAALPYDAIGGGGDGGAELALRAADGSAVPVFLSQEMRRLPGGLEVRGLVHGLGPLRAAQAGLQAAEQRFRRFLEEVPLGIALLDGDGRIEQCNRAFRMIAGGDEAALDGRRLSEVVQAEDRAAVEERLRRGAEAGAPVAASALDLRLMAAPGRFALLSLARRESLAGEPPGLLALLVDATEQKRLETQFVQSQKMQAVGQLAGGIAHDFNNLLTAMIGFCDLLLLRHRAGDQSFADIMQIKQNANRAAGLVRQLLAFSRQQALQPRVLDVTDVLAELSHLLRRLIGENIELEIVHDRELWPVKVDHGQLEQVIINLAVNARDAMPGGGRLTIRTRNLSLAQTLSRDVETMPAGDYVVIEVADTGSGIPPEILDRIFDPFFSTKEVGQGTGLGLSTVYGIVRQTGGFVLVDSELGHGSTFAIYLPRHAGATAAEPAREGGETVRDLTGMGTILLVEDEDAVRLFSARALRNKGYQVLEARHGEAALEILEVDKSAVDLLITDVVMPKMDGPTLAREIWLRRPEMKVIFISGYAEDDFRRRLGENDGIQFLPKPFSLKQLAAKVKEALRDNERLLQG